jgi:hypothetical protein
VNETPFLVGEGMGFLFSGITRKRGRGGRGCGGSKIKGGGKMQAFAWPLALVIIVIFFMILFRRQIGNLIPHIRKIGRNGLETHPPQLLQKESEDRLPTKDFMREFDNAVWRAQEDLIKKDLEDKNLSIEGKINYLTKKLAVTSLARSFEFIYSSIWGSQIQILKLMNSQNGVPIEVIKPFYDLASNNYPVVFTNYPFEKYMDFLAVHGLILKKNDLSFITEYGREFLAFLVYTGKSEFRLY